MRDPDLRRRSRRESRPPRDTPPLARRTAPTARTPLATPRPTPFAHTSAPRSKWGGARPGAGRPAQNPIASQPHKRRPPLARGESVRVVARVVRAVGDLNRSVARVAIARAVARSRARSDFTITELAIHPQPTARPRATPASRAPRLELVVEATDRLALARGMQGFQVSLARALNAAANRRGTVFVDRYATRAMRRRTRT